MGYNLESVRVFWKELAASTSGVAYKVSKILSSVGNQSDYALILPSPRSVLTAEEQRYWFGDEPPRSVLTTEEQIKKLKEQSLKFKQNRNTGPHSKYIYSRNGQKTT